jgi:hypothetical protein
MRKLVVWLVLLLMVSSVLVPVGVGYTKSEAKTNLVVAAGELNMWGDWSINPCKYTYEQNENNARVSITVNNLSNEDMVFDMEDGKILTVPAFSSREYEYRIRLTGQTERVRIVKPAGSQGGLNVQEALVLKIEPRTKGK